MKSPPGPKPTGRAEAIRRGLRIYKGKFPLPRGLVLLILSELSSLSSGAPFLRGCASAASERRNVGSDHDRDVVSWLVKCALCR